VGGVCCALYMYIFIQQLTYISISIYVYLDTTIRYTYIREYVIYTHTYIHHIYVTYTSYIRIYLDLTIHVLYTCAQHTEYVIYSHTNTHHRDVYVIRDIYVKHVNSTIHV